MIWVIISPQTFEKVEQKTTPISVVNHPKLGINSWIPLILYHSRSEDLSNRSTTWDVAYLTYATGPKAKYLSKYF